jgi:thioredoxin-related protein
VGRRASDPTNHLPFPTGSLNIPLSNKKSSFIKISTLRKLFFGLLVIVCCQTVCAQMDTSLVYLRFPTVPPFKITNVADSSAFTKADLKKKTATIIMIFSPDCEHCRHETTELLAHIDLFKKAQIIMASPLDYGFIKQFYDEFKLADHSNIVVGRDPGYFLGTFYSIHSYPSIFLYDKKGNFVQSFNGNDPVEKIASLL